MDTALSCSCSSTRKASRCDATLPDAPDCAIAYHFGMLLGVEDLRAEQGFHLGQRRRHQRALHGSGVVWGYPVTFEEATQEIRVGRGHAVDGRGRDLVLGADQCLGLPAWWEVARTTDAFEGHMEGDPFDADVLLCYRACLARPVPAIADPCEPDLPEIAYSRICEEVQLSLVRRTEPDPAPGPPPYRLLRRLSGELPPQAGADEDWLAAAETAVDGAAPDDRTAARADLWRRTAARAAAATVAPLEEPHWRPPLDIEGLENRADCLVVAKLRGVRLTRGGDGSLTATVDGIEIDGRATLLPAAVLQALAAAAAPPGATLAGPAIVEGSGDLSSTALSLLFDKPLAPESRNAFTVSAFDPATGWSNVAVTAVALSDGDRLATLTLDAEPAAPLVRVVATGTGPAPLLGADLVPLGAGASDPGGRDLTLTLIRS